MSVAGGSSWETKRLFSPALDVAMRKSPNTQVGVVKTGSLRWVHQPPALQGIWRQEGDGRMGRGAGERMSRGRGDEELLEDANHHRFVQNHVGCSSNSVMRPPESICFLPAL